MVSFFRLLGKERLDSLVREQQAFAREEDNGLSLQGVVDKYHPTILIGVTAVGGLFTQELVSSMAQHVDRPIVFPLSNPTTKAECTAEQAFEWTDGRCVFASGSPFDPVEMNGKTYYTSQCNNSKPPYEVEIFDRNVLNSHFFLPFLLQSVCIPRCGSGCYCLWSKTSYGSYAVYCRQGISRVRPRRCDGERSSLSSH